jgi:hypothetical protein
MIIDNSTQLLTSNLNENIINTQTVITYMLSNILLMKLKILRIIF